MLMKTGKEKVEGGGSREMYQLADYILNHYDKNSHKDKLVLGRKLDELAKQKGSTQ